MKNTASLWPTSWPLQEETMDFEKDTEIHALESATGSVINLNQNDSCHTSIESGSNSHNDRNTQLLMTSSKQQTPLSATSENSILVGVSPKDTGIGLQSLSACHQKSILLSTSGGKRPSCKKVTLNTKTTTDGNEMTIEQSNQLDTDQKPFVPISSHLQGIAKIKDKRFQPIYNSKPKSVLKCKKQMKKSNFRTRSLRHSLCIEWRKNQRLNKQPVSSSSSSSSSVSSPRYPTPPSLSSLSSSSFSLKTNSVQKDNNISSHRKSKKLDFEGLKQLVPSLQGKQGTKQVQIMNEAVDYIKELQRQLQQRFISSRDKEMADDFLATRLQFHRQRCGSHSQGRPLY